MVLWDGSFLGHCFCEQPQGPAADRGITTIITALFFFSGINAVFLGIIGEYVGRIYQQIRYGRRVAIQRLLNFDEDSSATG